MGYRVDDLTSFPIFLPVSIGSLGTSLTSLPAIPQTQSTPPPSGRGQPCQLHLLPHLNVLTQVSARVSSYLCGFPDHLFRTSLITL